MSYGLDIACSNLVAGGNLPLGVIMLQHLLVVEVEPVHPNSTVYKPEIEQKVFSRLRSTGLFAFSNMHTVLVGMANASRFCVPVPTEDGSIIVANSDSELSIKMVPTTDESPFDRFVTVAPDPLYEVILVDRPNLYRRPALRVVKNYNRD